MAERRRNRRRPRQLQVRFWKQGEEGQGSRAISTNISRTGIFVRTQMVLPSGTRMRIAVGHSGRSCTIEGGVMRALPSPAHLQSALRSGMGVRFLGPEELLEELLPSIDFQAEERVLGGFGSQAAAVQNETPPPLSHSPSSVERRLDEAAAPKRETAATAPPPARPAPHPSSTGTHEIIQPTQLFPLRFRDPDQFRRVFDRDVKTGGLFIHTSKPPALDAVILVEVVVEGLAAEPAPPPAGAGGHRRAARRAA